MLQSKISKYVNYILYIEKSLDSRLLDTDIDMEYLDFNKMSENACLSWSIQNCNHSVSLFYWSSAVDDRSQMPWRRLEA